MRIDRDGATDRLFGDRQNPRRAVASRKQTADRMHQRQGRRSRRECEQDRLIGPGGKLGEALDDILLWIMDQAIHANDMIRTGPTPGRACCRRRTRCASRKAVRSALSRARAISVGDRSMATTLAPRRAAATAKAPVPQPASRIRRPVRSCGNQPRSASRIRSTSGPHGLADASQRRIGRQSGPCLDRGSIEIGFDRRHAFLMRKARH